MKRTLLPNSIKIFVIFLTIILLMACGSGGGGDSAGTTSSGGSNTSSPATTTTDTPSISSITIWADNDKISADGVSSTKINAQVKNNSNNGVADVVVLFSTDAGIIESPMTTDTQGKGTVTLISANSSSNIDAIIKATSGNVTSNSIKIEFIAQKFITGRALDNNGIPIPNATVTSFSEELTVVTDENGYYSMFLPDGDHAVVISHPDYVENIRGISVSGSDSTINNDGILIASNVTAQGHAFSTTKTFESNYFDDTTKERAKLTIHPQLPNKTAKVNGVRKATADIAIEYLDINQILPVPLPNAENTKGTLNVSSFVDGENPSVMISIKPATLELTTPALLTLPNPDKLTQAAIRYYNAVDHTWKSGKTSTELWTMDGTTGPQSIQILKGGVYGIFFTDEELNHFTLVQGVTPKPNSIVFIGDKMLQSNNFGYFSAKLFVPKDKEKIKAYIYDPETGSMSPISVNTDSEKPVDAFVAYMDLRASPESIHADGESTSNITALLKNWDNNPVVGVNVEFSSTDGTIQHQAQTDYLGRASVTLVSANEAKDITVTAKYSTYQDAIQVKFVEPPAPAPAKISISIPTNVISTIIGDKNETEITAYISDSNNYPIKDGTNVTFSTTAGSFGSITIVKSEYNVTSNKGVAKAILKSLPNVVGTATITVSAGNIKESADVIFASGPVKNISILPQNPILTADGKSELTITAYVTDVNGNAVMNGETIIFDRQGDNASGTFSSTTNKTVTASTINGMAFVKFLAGSLAGEVTITARYSSLDVDPKTTVIQMVNLPVGAIELQTSEISLKPNKSCELTAIVKDIKENRLNYPVVVNFSTNYGDINAQETGVQNIMPVSTSNGIAKVTLTSPSNIIGTAIIKASIGQVSDSIQIEFVPGPVATIRLTAEPDIIKADGKSTSTITALVYDQNGNFVLNGETIRFTGGGGTLDFTNSTQNGQSQIVYQSTLNAGTVSITATATTGVSSSINIIQKASIPANMSLSASQVKVKSDNSDDAIITVTILDKNNTVLPDIPIRFSAEGGQLSIGSAKTDSEGKVQTTFSSGTIDQHNRTVLITAEVEGLTPELKKQIPINIYGTTLTLQTNNQELTSDGNVKALLTISVKDAGGNPTAYNTPVFIGIDKTAMTIVNKTNSTPVTVISGATVENYVQTNVEGDILLELIGTQVGDVTFTATALGASGAQKYNIISKGYILSIKEPLTEVNELAVGQALKIVAGYEKQNISLMFSTSIGSLTGTTNTGKYVQELISNNQATVYFSSQTAGLATIQIYDPSAPSISKSIRVAIYHPPEKAKQIILQADPKVIKVSTTSVTNQSIIRAKVLTDQSLGSQVVGKAAVAFSIENPSGGGEYINPVIVYTDNSGLATTTFTSGTLGSDASGIIIKAWLVDNKISQTISVVVTGPPTSMTIGLGTESRVVNATTYATPMSIIVTDANGNRMPNVNITLSLWPLKYSTGFRLYEAPCDPVIIDTFDNEDKNMNMILDPGEDLNNDGQLTPPNSASGNVPSTVTTGEDGVANFELVYLKHNAVWIKNQITASTVVHGSATTETLIFRLPYVVNDACYLSSSPYNTNDSISKPTKISLSTSQVTVKSDNSDKALITAIVLDENNSVLTGINVNFKTDSIGQFSKGSAVTDAEGKASVYFSSGTLDKSNKTVTISAEVSGLTPIYIPIVIAGSTIEFDIENTNITAPPIDGREYSKVTANLEITVKDAGGTPVYNTPVLISVENSGDRNVEIYQIINGEQKKFFSTLSMKQNTTMSNVMGKVSLVIEGLDPGDVRVKATALNASTFQDFHIAYPDNAFGIIYPNVDPFNLYVGEPLSITVRAPNVITVVFSTTSGGFGTAAQPVFDVTVVKNPITQLETATAILKSDVAGLATIQVYDKDRFATSDSLKVAFSQPIEKADKILLQSSAASLPVSTKDIKNTITLNATVFTDFNSGRQVVENAPVLFSIVNPTGGGEYISPVIVYTNSSGIASTKLTSGSLGSSAEGIIIKAIVISKPTVNNTINIVIGGIAGSVAIGRGGSSSIVSIDSSTYALPMSVLVSDVNGNRVSGAIVSLSAWPEKYYTGYWRRRDTYYSTLPPCYVIDEFAVDHRNGPFNNEDINENLFNDPGEDINNDGELTPPNSAAGNLPATVITDENGVAKFELIYLKGSAVWITDRIQARTLVHGTETVSSVSINLPFLESEVCDLPDSPFINPNDAVSSILLKIGKDLLTAGDFCEITAVVKDDRGDYVPNNTIVLFEIRTGTEKDENDTNPLDDDPIRVLKRFTALTQNGYAVGYFETPTNILGEMTIEAASGRVITNKKITIIPGPVHRILMKATPNNLNADGEDSCMIETIITDQNGNPVYDGETIAYSVVQGFGVLSSPLSSTIDGTSSVSFISSYTPGTVVVRATSRSNPTIYKDVKITLIKISSEIETIILQKEKVALTADGQSSCGITATIFDTLGNLLEDGTLVTFSTNKGDLDDPNNPISGVQSIISVPVKNGIAWAKLTSPTNDLGRADIIVSVGGKSATAELTIKSGPVDHIVISASPNNLTADGHSTSRINVFVTDLKGNPVANGESIIFSINGDGIFASTGGKMAYASTENGEASVKYIAPNVPGSSEITVRSESSLTVEAKTTISMIKSEIEIVTIETNTPLLQVGGESGLFTATVLDSSGEFVPNGTLVTFTTEAGDLDPFIGQAVANTQRIIAVPTINGKAVARLTSPNNQIGSFRVFATCGGKTSIRVFEVEPGPVKSITLSCSASNMTANGQNKSYIHAVITDEFGNLVSNGESITFSLNGIGNIVSIDGAGSQNVRVAAVNGEANIYYHATTEPGIAIITATSADGLVTQDITITIIEPEIGDIKLHSSHTILEAGNHSCAITAMVINQDGVNVPNGTLITFESTVGDFDNQLPGIQNVTSVPIVNGFASIQLTSPVVLPQKDGQMEISAVVKATAGGFSKDIVIQVIPGTVSRITLSANKNNISADGISTSTIQAIVSDISGNLVSDGEMVEMSLVGSGTISNNKGVTGKLINVSTVNGIASITYKSGLEKGTATIIATSSSQPVTSQIELVLISATVGDVQVQSEKVMIHTGGETCAITAVVKNEFDGIIPDGTLVTFITTAGDLNAQLNGAQQIISTQTINGMASITLSSLNTLVQVDNLIETIAEIKVEVGGKSATTQVKILPGPINNITFSKPALNLTADGQSTSTIKAIVTDSFGNLVSNGEYIVFTLNGTGSIMAPNGSISPTITLATKNGEASIIYQTSIEPGNAIITASSISGDITEAVSIVLIEPEVGTIKLQSSQFILEAGASPSEITAWVTNSIGYPVPNGTLITFSTTVGDLNDQANGVQRIVSVPTVNGIASVRLTSPIALPQSDGNMEIQAKITASAGGVEKDLTIQFMPGAVDKITVSADVYNLKADGKSSTPLKVIVTDQYGNLVSDGELLDVALIGSGLIENSNGVVGQQIKATTLNGVANMIYYAGNQPGTSTIIATSSSQSISGQTNIELISAEVSDIQISGEYALLEAGGNASLFTAVVLDAYGRKVPDGTKVTFTTTIGDMDDYLNPKTGVQRIVTVLIVNGKAVARLTSPANILGNAVIKASAGGLSAETNIEIVPGPVANMVMTIQSDPIDLSGTNQRSSEIIVNATDLNGNIVMDGETILFHIAVLGGDYKIYTKSTQNGECKLVYTMSSSAETLLVTATSASTGVFVSRSINLTDPNSATPAQMSLSASQVTVQSDNSDQAIITAIILDDKYTVLPGIQVNFSANGGQISKGASVTNELGRATTTFSSGDLDRNNRIVTITAIVEGIVKTIPVEIAGSTVSLEADKTSITDDGSIVSNVTVSAKDAGQIAVFDTPVVISKPNDGVDLLVTVKSSSGNTDYTLSNTSNNMTVNTNVRGQVDLIVKGVDGKTGTTTLSVNALGTKTSQIFSVNMINAAFGIIDTRPGLEVNQSIVQLKVGEPLTISVNAGTSNASMVTVVFSSSIGQFSNGQKVTKMVLVPESVGYTTLTSSLAGLASIQVYREDNPILTDSLKVAIAHPPDQAGKIELQANAMVLPVSTDSIKHMVDIKATVLTSSAQGNQVVGGAPVVFSIENPTGGGEFLSPVVVFTNSAGVAKTTFTSGTLGSDAKGITITARIIDNQAVAEDSIRMIIGGTPGSISIGIGTKAEEINSTTYKLPVSVLVSDANGNKISGTEVSLNIWPEKYSTGYWSRQTPCQAFMTGTFYNEDTNGNLILDPGEDKDNDGKLTPPNSSAGNIPSKVITDDNGMAEFDIVYLKTSIWISDRLTASTVVKGTEATAQASFRLPYLIGEECSLPSSPYAAPSDQQQIVDMSITPAVTEPLVKVIAGGMSCNNTTIGCSERTIPIVARLYDISGNPGKDGIVVTFKTTAGGLTSINSILPPLTDNAASKTLTATTSGGVAQVKLFSANKLGNAVITVSVNELSDSTSVQFIPGAPKQISIVPSPASLPADGASQSTVRVVVLDAAGNPVNDGEAVNVSVIHGSLDIRVGYTKDGVVTFIYNSPSSLPEGQVDTFTVQMTNGETSNGKINLTGPPIASIDLTVEPESLPADGVSEANIFATVNLVGGGQAPDGTTVNFSIVNWQEGMGSLDSSGANPMGIVGLTAGGIARIKLTAGNSSFTSATIRAEAGGRTTEVIVIYTMGSVDVAIMPNSLLGTGDKSAVVTAVAKSVTGTLLPNEIITFTLSDTSMGGFSTMTDVDQMSASGGTSSITCLTNANGEARVTFIGAAKGGAVNIIATWKDVSGLESVNIQPPPAFIEVAENSPSPTAINIKGTGGQSVSQIVFNVKDTSGNLVADGYKIKFLIDSGPDGGEGLLPTFAYTKDGTVNTILRSGFKSGPVSVKATYFNDTSISTTTSQVAIKAGPPVGEEFGISAKYLNISGLNITFLEDLITVNAGDVYGNAIPDNTAIAFKTYNTGGLFYPSTNTTTDGKATNTLISTANPIPIQGFVSITAEANNGGRTTHITSIAVSPPPNNHIIYVSTNGGGVYKSTDGGITWKNISRSSEFSGQNWIAPYVNEIEVDPDDMNTLYAATGYLGNGNLYRSIDGGQNWNSNNSEEWYGLIQGINGAVLTVLCDGDSTLNGTESPYVWIGTNGQGIWYSKNGETFYPGGEAKATGDSVLADGLIKGNNNKGTGSMSSPVFNCNAIAQNWTATYNVEVATIDEYKVLFTPVYKANNVKANTGAVAERWTITYQGNNQWSCVGSVSGDGNPYTAFSDQVYNGLISFKLDHSSDYTPTQGMDIKIDLRGSWEFFGTVSSTQKNHATNNATYITDNGEFTTYISESSTNPFGHGDAFTFSVTESGIGCGKVIRDIVKLPNTYKENAVLYAATPTGIYRSVGGIVWHETADFPGDNIISLDVGKDAANNSIIFAGAQDAGVWMTVLDPTFAPIVEWTNYLSGMGYLYRATTPMPDDNNKGNGTMAVKLVDSNMNTQTETWTIECIEAKKDGGKFSVNGTSSGTWALSVTVGESVTYSGIELLIKDGTVDFQVGDHFTYRTIRDPGTEIKDLLVDHYNKRLYAITYFWGVLEPHAVGCIYTMELDANYRPVTGIWERTKAISGLPQFEPPDDTSLYAQHVMAFNNSDQISVAPDTIFVGGEGINFYRASNGVLGSDFSTGTLKWKMSKDGLSNLIMARMPVLFTDDVVLSVKENLISGDTKTAVYQYIIYAEDFNGNPPIVGSTLQMTTYKLEDGNYKEIETTTLIDYPDTYIASATYRDPSNYRTNNPIIISLTMGEEEVIRKVLFLFTPTSESVAPGSSGSTQKRTFTH